MEDKAWYIIDTETNGLDEPRYVVDIAAQRMAGWEKDGPPFRCLINHGVSVSDKASRLHGYTKEILQKKGVPPEDAYNRFRKYVMRYAGGRYPIAAYNVSFDWDKVLIPEWGRLDISPIGERGICILKLAQRLLSPSPAGNHKLQSLREYYDLNGGQAHSALGDVEVTVELVQRVLKQKAEAEGVRSWSDLENLIENTHPTQIWFGKYKGRDFHDAKLDLEFRDWLRWIATKGGREAKAGRWYLSKLGYSAESLPRTKSPTIQLSKPDRAVSRSKADTIPLSSGTTKKRERASQTSRPAQTSTSRVVKDASGSKSANGCVWSLVGLALAFGFMLIVGNYEGRNKKASNEAFKRQQQSVERLRREQAPQLSNQQYSPGTQSQAPQISLTAPKTPPTAPTKSIPQEAPSIPPAKIPTEFRSWTTLDGRTATLRAISLNYESQAVTFQMEDGTIGMQIKIKNLVPKDQEFLLGSDYSE